MTDSLVMNTAGLVVFIAVLGLAIYDLIVVLRKGTGSSVSQFLIRAGFKSPLVVSAFAMSFGHLFLVMWDTDCVMNWPERLTVAGCGAVIGAVITHVAKTLTSRP